jgi:hypothetical protein
MMKLWVRINAALDMNANRFFCEYPCAGVCSPDFSLHFQTDVFYGERPTRQHPAGLKSRCENK